MTPYQDDWFPLNDGERVCRNI